MAYSFLVSTSKGVADGGRDGTAARLFRYRAAVIGSIENAAVIGRIAHG